MSRRTALLLIFACAALAAVGLAELALAQGTPFGVGRPSAPPPPPPTGITGWMLMKQAEFYRSLSSLVRAAKADGSAVWALLGVSFLYGVFHAAGPGHGKAVISSYLVANDETWRRGVVLSFASALLQSAVAVAVVGIAAALLGATAKMMADAVRWIEITSYALIAVLGARLLWSKGRLFLAELRASRQAQPFGAPALAAAGTGTMAHHHHHDHALHEHGSHDHAAHRVHHDHAHHDHAHHDHAHHDHAHHDHAHHSHSHVSHDHGATGHVHDEHCGHAHGPEPAELAGAGGWQRGLTAIFAVGLRPCSGAILVLVFALAQGLFWAGVAATFVMGLGTALAVAGIATLAVGARGLAGRLAGARGGGGLLALRGLEVAAATLVLAFGVLLLLGYVASERLGMT